MKKNKTVYFLIIWFILAAARDIEVLFSFDTVTDYLAFSNVGLAPLFFLCAIVVLLLNLASIVFFFRPREVGLHVMLAAILAAVIQDLFTMAISLSDLGKLKQAYIVSRQSRGLQVREDALEFIFSELGMYTACLSTVLFYVFMAYLIRRNKSYFQPLKNEAGSTVENA